MSRRTGTLLAAGVTLVALVAHLPAVGFLAGLGWSWLARFVDRVAFSLARRRAERGPRDRDLPMAVLGSPFHLLGSGLSALVTSVLPLFIGVAFAFGLDSLTGGVTGVPLSTPTTLAVGAAAASIVAWWGPGSSTLRRGSRSMARGVAPGRIGARVAATVLLAVASLLALATQSSGYELSWAPLPAIGDLLGWPWF